MVDKQAVESLMSQQQIMLDTVYRWSEINSGSLNLTGLATMHDVLKKAFSPLADKIESIQLAPATQVDMQGENSELMTGSCLLMQKRPELKRRILLCGHMDTVFGLDSPFQTPRMVNDNCLNGPGVTDMKGGLCVMLNALQHFEQSPQAENIGWDVFINADEELGSPASGPYLENMAQNYQCALVYEPSAKPDGTLAYSRKGSGKFTVVVEGRAAHAGRDFNEGRNAICKLAELISEINALNGKRQALTINVGLISGGRALNIVAERAVCKLDVRYEHPSDKQWLMDKFNALVARFNKEGAYRVTLHGQFGRPVKTISPECHQLFETIKRIAASIGLSLGWQNSGGCCDGNNLAHAGLPVVDTLGVRGGHIHSPEEYLLIDSLVERAQLSSLLMMHLAEEFNS